MSFFDKAVAYNSKHRVPSHVFFWLVMLLLQLSSSSYYNNDIVPFRNNLIGDSTNLAAQIPAAYFLAYFIVPKFFYKQRYAESFVYFLVCAYVICVLSRIEVIHFEEPLYGRKPNPKETFTEIFTDIPKLAYVYFFRIFSIAFVFMFLKLLKDQLLVQKRALSLEKQKAETELKFLKAQLNPHFLFNTLNNIYSLSLSGAATTSTAIARLSEILDHMLYRCDTMYVPLSSEINLLSNYIGLEKLRYDERLNVEFNTAVNEEVKIAPLLLLTIVENAFKHGAGEDAGKPEINIDLKADEDRIFFTVRNSFNASGGRSESDKIGLSNLTQQLDLVYPGTYSLDIGVTDLYFTVTLHINLTPANK